MSIEKRAGSLSRSFRTLIISGAPEAEKRLRSLRTLGIFISIRCYRHAGPKGPEELGGCLPGPVRDQAIPNYSYVMLGFRDAAARSRFFARPLFRSFRTLMSIEKRVGFVFKVRKDLNNERRV